MSIEEKLDTIMSQNEQIIAALGTLKTDKKLTRKQAAEILGVQPHTIDNYRRDGILTNVGVKSPRFSLEQVMNYKKNQM